LDLAAQLDRDEAIRLFPYDDATGVTLSPGMTLKGNITIGTGRNLTGNGISDAERILLRTNDINAATAAVHNALPWTVGLDLVRYSVLLNLAFNEGVRKLLGFKNMLAALQVGNYKVAAAQLLNSVLAEEEPARAHRLSIQLETGVWV
jgi:lysozyme